MAITVDEKFESRESMTGPNAWIERVYVIRGTDDDIAAKDALGSASPTTYDGLVRKSRHVERLGEELWEGTARYGRPDQNATPPETGDSVFSFDTGGGTQHITQSSLVAAAVQHQIQHVRLLFQIEPVPSSATHRQPRPGFS